ncbi:hypothetical protein [Liberiplasma polymorphum]|uniref:hypothetical protein n=1 Tax=Liberiplasma polymorphum TaxID=3374570 RepID=UPI00377188C1
MLKKLTFKKSLFALLLLFVVAGSSLAFAWWDQLEIDRDETIDLGYGVRLEIESVVEDERILVPAGSFYAAYEADYTTEYSFTYVLKLEEPLKEGMLANLITEITSFEVNGVAYTNVPKVFTVTIEVGASSSETLELTVENAFTDSVNTVTVLVTITLEPQSNEDLTLAEYNAIAGGEVSFNIAFELVNNGSSLQE